MERLVFLRAYLRHWRTIGSLTPSSRHLARRMLELLDPDRARLVAELGAGTGAITGPLLQHLVPQSRLLAVEIYPPFAAYLRARFPDPRLEVIQDSAELLPEHLAARGVTGADAILCSIPFSTMPATMRHRVMAAACRSLLPDGVFIAYQYSPFHLAPLLKTYFAQTTRSLVLWNLPPAFVYRAASPRTPAVDRPQRTLP